MFVLLFICVILLRYSTSEMRYSKGGARKRFEKNFHETCSKYTFVSKYINMLENPGNEYVIFVFHEPGHSNGGLGDRLAGMLSALAYAIRSGRTFLIVGDESFEDAFQPYYHTQPHNYTWKSWDWANWNREFASNMTKLHCVNPPPNRKHCALEYDKYKHFKVVKYYGNRSYICRWLVKQSLQLADDIKQHLQITSSTDLYEVAGCLLRLAMWPTDKLWDALDDSLEPQFQSRRSAETAMQIGFHFRCGDSSFSQSSSSSGGGVRKPNPECYFDPSTPWKGTNFMDDTSLDSPVDEATCGKQLLTAASSKLDSFNGNSKSTNVLAYIASDNADSSNQINNTLHWPLTIKPPQGCHVDLQKSAHCTLSTSLHWFMLSLSDHIVMQALIKPAVSMFDNSPETAHLAKYEQPAPISAFSRYAAIYSLSKDSIRYGKGCVAVNQTALSQQTHGNWVCDPKTFY